MRAGTHFRHRVLPNGVREPLLDHTHFLHHQNGSVTVLNISDMESGPYVCWAWNRVGSDIAYIHLYNSHPGGSLLIGLIPEPNYFSVSRRNWSTVHSSLVPTPCCHLITPSLLPPSLPHSGVSPSHHHLVTRPTSLITSSQLSPNHIYHHLPA